MDVGLPGQWVKKKMASKVRQLDLWDLGDTSQGMAGIHPRRGK